ncbi:hypothetical protein QFZ63_001272 [Streptomyces sp. B3I7]|uniref:hypothetical protein n=1 Tax=Streptomyces sp. B3I7 TaxID=3042269 RepID=UPI00277E4940|nr:hypothetical protein [Streptomyces sp. B3I7]MDQ0809558.1 hypothetical protein [Streptomyces sp. B3I7]
MHRWKPALLIAGLLATTVTGCGGGTSAPAPTAPTTRAASGAHRAADDPERTLYLAEQVLIKKCMEKRGHEYWVEPPPPKDVSARFPLVVDDPAWARTHGYGTDLRRRREAEVRADPNRKYFRSASTAGRAALVSDLNGPRPQGLSARLPNGVRVTHSDRGCQAAAQRELYGDLEAWFRATRVTGALNGLRLGLVTGDKRYKAAVAPWARCMRGRGHPYTDPAESRAAATREDRPWPRAKEVGLASAEADCAASSGLSDVVRSLNTEYRAELGRRHPRETADLTRLEREALPRARVILARGD